MAHQSVYMMIHTWEWVASELFRATGLGAHPDAMALAWACELELWPEQRTGGLLDGCRVRYDQDAPEAVQREQVARCVAEWALTWCEVPITRDGIAHVADAISRPSSSSATRAAAVVLPFRSADRRDGRRFPSHVG